MVFSSIKLLSDRNILPKLLCDRVFRLLKALGAPQSSRIFWAGGSPLGGKEALLPLIREFPHFYNKEDLALPGELKPFANKASQLAAIDSIVSENSDVFMASHGGNMGHAIQVPTSPFAHELFCLHRWNIYFDQRGIYITDPHGGIINALVDTVVTTFMLEV